MRFTATIRAWSVALRVARRAGAAARFVAGGGRAGPILGGLVAAAALLRQDWRVLAAGALAALVWSAWRARSRVVVEDLLDARATRREPPAEGAPAEASGTALTGSAALLASQLVTVNDLFRQAASLPLIDARAGGERVPAPGVSLADVGDLLRGAVAAGGDVNIGPLRVALGAPIALLSRLVEGPHLRGCLWGDERTGLVLTAQLRVRGSDHSWRIERRPGAQSAGADRPLVEEMIDELAYRVFTDLALGPERAWLATRGVAEALREFIASASLPRGRKLTLRRAEGRLTEAVAEDEEFVLAYYNLGVAYLQLSEVGGPTALDDAHAAAAAIRLAIEHDPARWEGYYALAYAQRRIAFLRREDASRERLSEILGLYERALALAPGRASAAVVLNAKGLAERSVDDLDAAIASRRAACRLSLGALARAELRGRPAPELAGLRERTGWMLLNLAIAHTYALPDDAPRTGLRNARRFARVRALAELGVALALGDGSARLEYGKLAEHWGRLDIARRQLATAAQMLPESALAWAHLGRVAALQGDAVAAEAACSRALREAEAEAAADADGQRAALDVLYETCELMGANDMVMRVARTAALEETVRALEDWPRDDAIARLEELLEESHEAPGREWEAARVAHRLARIAIQERQAEHAEELLRFAMRRLGPAHRAVQRWGLRGDLASALTMRRRLDEALEEAEAALALDPLSHWEHKVLAGVHEATGDYPRARKAWRRALLRQPDDPDANSALGVCCWRLAQEIGDAATAREMRLEAVEHLRTALLLYPDRALGARRTTNYYLARAQAALVDFDAAIRHLHLVLATGDAGLQLLAEMLLGDARLRLGSFAEAERHLQAAIEAGEAWVGDGDVAPEPDPAPAEAGEAPPEAPPPSAPEAPPPGAPEAPPPGAPEAPPRPTLLTDCGETVGDPFALGVVLALAHQLLAVSLARRRGDLDRAEGHVAQAEDYLRRVREASPGAYSALERECRAARGRILLARDDPEAAVRELERAAAGDPDAETYYVLATAYRAAALEAGDEADRSRLVRRARECCVAVREMDAQGLVLEQSERLDAELAAAV